MSTEHNLATSIVEKMFTNYNSSLLRQHIVNKQIFVFYPVEYLAIQPYL